FPKRCMPCSLIRSPAALRVGQPAALRRPTEEREEAWADGALFFVLPHPLLSGLRRKSFGG
uniref:hypothetical protein n=1 Tax=Streptomyces adelaidensis TaxID=2796465 RepID=UPI001F1EFD63